MKRSHHPNPLTGPQLPQDVIDIIIEAVASQKDHKSWMDTLRSCSIVSFSFHFPARKHIFAYIDFLIDRYTDERAHRLRRILERNHQVISTIRSVRLHFRSTLIKPQSYIPGTKRLARISSQSRELVSKTFAKLYPREDSLMKMIQILKCAPYRKITIEANATGFQWLSEGAIRALCENRDLHTIRVVGISHLEPFITTPDRPHKLFKETVLANVSRFLPLTHSSDSNVSRSYPLYEVESLDVHNTNLSQFLNLLRGVTLSDERPSYFRNLTKLAVCLYPGCNPGALRSILSFVRQSLTYLHITFTSAYSFFSLCSSEL